MALFSIVAATPSEGAEEGEFDGRVAEFDDAEGSGPRHAEDTLGLATQLAADFHCSHVSVLTGVPPETADIDGDALVGMWLVQPDGVDWTTLADLRANAGPGAEAVV